MGVQRHNLPHFKGLIVLYLDVQAQGRDTTFTFHHAHLKKAVLYRKNRDRSDTFSSVCSLAPVRICHALLRTRITNESNFSDGQSYCQGVLEVSDL